MRRPQPIPGFWLSIGGLIDMTRLYKDLREAIRDYDDDGTVRDHDFEVKPDQEPPGA